MNNILQEIREGQSIELLKELHILTRDGKINQDSRRKLKQVYHLFQFIEPLLNDLMQTQKKSTRIVDHGAGKSYLGFILYDLFFNNPKSVHQTNEFFKMGHIYGIETRDELVQKSNELKKRLGFSNMSFLNLSVADSIQSKELPEEIEMVTALHACDTATDDAIHFGLIKKAKYFVLVPCCQAEVAQKLKSQKGQKLSQVLTEIYRHPIHTREFGSHLTNVLRCLLLEAYGYQVTVTELTGLEHSMKNELILAKKIEQKRPRQIQRLNQLLSDFQLEELQFRFNTELF